MPDHLGPQHGDRRAHRCDQDDDTTPVVEPSRYRVLHVVGDEERDHQCALIWKLTTPADGVMSSAVLAKPPLPDDPVKFGRSTECVWLALTPPEFRLRKCWCRAFGAPVTEFRAYAAPPTVRLALPLSPVPLTTNDVVPAFGGA